MCLDIYKDLFVFYLSGESGTTILFYFTKDDTVENIIMKSGTFARDISVLCITGDITQRL